MHTGNTILIEINISMITVYPCAYREHGGRICYNYLNCGLSLCIQGTQLVSPDFDPFARFIPVHTGNTVEYSINPLMFNGLSLCIQGTRTIINLNIEVLRFIPVHTGNTVSGGDSAGSGSVYPCAYREHPNYNILFYN